MDIVDSTPVKNSEDTAYWDNSTVTIWTDAMQNKCELMAASRTADHGSVAPRRHPGGRPQPRASPPPHNPDDESDDDDDDSPQKRKSVASKPSSSNKKKKGSK